MPVVIGFALSGQVVAGALERHVAEHGAPVSITVDHGTEFTLKAFEELALDEGNGFALIDQHDAAHDAGAHATAR